MDRSGLAQVMLRDRYAGPHTPKTAIGKAWTAASFSSDTTTAKLTQPGKPASGIRELPNVVIFGGVSIAGRRQHLGRYRRLRRVRRRH